jgi:hypothetical protein
LSFYDIQYCCSIIDNIVFKKSPDVRHYAIDRTLEGQLCID